MAHNLGRSFIAIAVVTILFQVNAKEYTDEQKEQFFAEVKACVKSSNLSDDEFETIVAKKELPTSEEGKCFTKCLMEKMEYLDESGRVNVMSMQAGVEESMDKEAEREQVKKFVKDCDDTNKDVSAEGCEYAYKMSECMYNKMKEAGISGS